MRHTRTIVIASAAVFVLLTPARAFAAKSTYAVPGSFSIGMGVFALAAAVVLLMEVSRLRRVAAGAAFADNMAYVMGGIICLATSVLVGWISNTTDLGFSAEQARFFSDALVGVAMVLLGVYFVRVRRAVVRYMDVLSGEMLLAKAHTGEEDEGPEEGGPGA